MHNASDYFFVMMAQYNISFELNGEVCHTIGKSTFPTVEAYRSGKYSLKAADDMAVSFVNGYLDVKNLLGKVVPHNICYTITFSND